MDSAFKLKYLYNVSLGLILQEAYVLNNENGGKLVLESCIL